ncbi:MAG: DUF5698 domain-containing protein [Acidaminobacteraceae bacterium]
MDVLLYFAILFFKVIEVSIGTIRIVMITRGERVYGALLGFFEVIIWIGLVSTVLKDVTDDPIKVVIYAAGFAIGNYTGSIFEQKIGIGNVRVEAIVEDHEGDVLANTVRREGYAVTVMEGKGMSHNRKVLLMNIKRKDYEKVVNIIKSIQNNVVITMNDIRPVYGGHGILKK